MRGVAMFLAGALVALGCSDGSRAPSPEGVLGRLSPHSIEKGDVRARLYLASRVPVLLLGTVRRCPGPGEWNGVGFEIERVLEGDIALRGQTIQLDGPCAVMISLDAARPFQPGQRALYFLPGHTKRAGVW